MNRNRIFFIVLAVVTLGLLLVVAPWSSPQPPTPKLNSGPVVAKVGDIPVYLSQVQSRYETMASIHGETGILDEEQLKQQILDSLKYDVVIVDGARDRTVGVSAVELAFFTSGPLNQAQNSQGATMEDALAGLGVSLAQLEYREYMDKLAARLYADVASEGISLTDQEIREYYRTHRNEFAISADEDPVVAFEAVKPEIAQILIKQKQDQAFSTWFADYARNYDIDIIMEDWWNRIEKETSSQAGSSVTDADQGATEGDAPPSPEASPET